MKTTIFRAPPHVDVCPFDACPVEPPVRPVGPSRPHEEHELDAEAGIQKTDTRHTKTNPRTKLVKYAERTERHTKKMHDKN